MTTCVSIDGSVLSSRDRSQQVIGKDDLMSRRRFQQGCLEKKGTRNPSWYIRYNEYCLKDGRTVKIQRSRLVGFVRDIPTEKLARRAVSELLEEINASATRPKNLITFSEFCDKWKTTVLPNHKPSSRNSETAHLKRLSEDFGKTCLADITTEKLQAWVTRQEDISPKTVRNYIATLRTMWRSARAWGYVEHKPFEDLIMPERGLVNKPCFTFDQAREIVRKADEPFKSMFRLVAETGIRGGEVCGLFVEDVDFENCLIHVRRSAWRGKLQTPKTNNAVRVFPISQQLSEHLREYIKARYDLAGSGAVRRGTAGSGSAGCGNLLDEHLSEYLVEVGSGKLGDAIISRPDGSGVLARDTYTAEQNPSSPNSRGEAGSQGQGAPASQHQLVARPASKLLFPNLAGNPYDNNNVVKFVLKPILKELKIDGRGKGLHAFRRGSASALGSIQAAPAVVKDRLGHGSFDMSMHYMSAVSADHRRVADELGKMFDPMLPSGDNPESNRAVTNIRDSRTANEVRGGAAQPSASDSGATGGDAVRLGIAVVSGDPASKQPVRNLDNETFAMGAD